MEITRLKTKAEREKEEAEAKARAEEEARAAQDEISKAASLRDLSAMQSAASLAKQSSKSRTKLGEPVDVVHEGVQCTLIKAGARESYQAFKDTGADGDNFIDNLRNKMNAPNPLDVQYLNKNRHDATEK